SSFLVAFPGNVEHQLDDADEPVLVPPRQPPAHPLGNVELPGTSSFLGTSNFLGTSSTSSMKWTSQCSSLPGNPGLPTPKNTELPENVELPGTSSTSSMT